jgi:molecular chaperone GrpE (heat shock protein)
MDQAKYENVNSFSRPGQFTGLPPAEGSCASSLVHAIFASPRAAELTKASHMSEPTAPRLNKLPFYVADIVLVVLAWWIMSKNAHPLALGPQVLVAFCVIAAFGFAVVPFILEYGTLVKLSEAGELADTVGQIDRLEETVEKIQNATSLWQGVQDHSGKTVAAAKELTERMSAEARSFTEFMRKSNDSEKATLRLEVEKLRRAEADWLQVLVRLMDNVYALHQAAVRSGQNNVTEQLGRFQNFCREATRRVGLAPIEAVQDEPFDKEKHQPFEASEPVPEDARVAETIATGYTFQGQVLRLPLVRLSGVELSRPESADLASLKSDEFPGRSDPAAQDELGLAVETGEERQA